MKDLLPAKVDSSLRSRQRTKRQAGNYFEAAEELQVDFQRSNQAQKLVPAQKSNISCLLLLSFPWRQWFAAKKSITTFSRATFRLHNKDDDCPNHDDVGWMENTFFNCSNICPTSQGHVMTVFPKTFFKAPGQRQWNFLNLLIGRLFSLKNLKRIISRRLI